jgi:FAD/FMN-containing dehydrogenase
MDDFLLPTYSGRLLRSGVDDLQRFEQPARGASGSAHGVALPENLKELREILSDAFESCIRLLPQGANSGLVGASVPPAMVPTSDVPMSAEIIVVSMERFRHHNGPDIEIVPSEGMAIVSSSVKLSALNDAAAHYGLHLPVDLGSDPMIGGMIATNTGGSRVVRYGSMKQHVLSAEAVTADAETSMLGSLHRLRKDSRGFDPTQLLVGSGGTLGIVTAAVILLSPIPKVVSTWWLAIDDVQRTTELFDFLNKHRPGTISAFEFVSKNALSRTLDHEGSPTNPFGATIPEGAALVEWSASTERELSNIESDIAAAADSCLLSDGRLTDGASAWGIRHRVSESLRTYGLVLGHDISTPRDRLMIARRDCIEAIECIAPNAIVCDFGHVGDGGLHLNLLMSSETPDTNLNELRSAIRAAIDGVVARHGGSYSAEHGLGPLNAERWLASTPPIEQAVIRSLKHTVDPRAILGHPGHPYNRLDSKRDSSLS